MLRLSVVAYHCDKSKVSRGGRHDPLVGMLARRYTRMLWLLIQLTLLLTVFFLAPTWISFKGYQITMSPTHLVYEDMLRLKMPWDNTTGRD